MATKQPFEIKKQILNQSIVLIVIAILLAILVIALVSQVAVEQGSLSSYDTKLLNDVSKQKTQREIDKLTAEIRQIRSETAGSLFWVKLLGVFVTVGGAVGGYILAQKETNKDRLEFEADKEEKRLNFEHRKDVDTAYQTIIQELTTLERPLLRAAAAMKLGSILQEFPTEWNVPEYRKKQLIQLTKNILTVALINEPEPKIRKVLTTSLAQDSNLQGLDLSEIQAGNAYWAKIDFSGTDFFKADLCCTSFRKAKLYRVQFRSANLQEAVLAEANCEETNFKLADLRHTNLRSTNMKGAIFVDANLEKADLLGAHNLSADQIKTAKNWELAHYDPELRVQLGLDS
jgi:uncharacterized protein YjbI with pentapeptide repeats